MFERNLIACAFSLALLGLAGCAADDGGGTGWSTWEDISFTGLDVAGVQALYGTPNLAAGKTATQSSTSYGGVASRAVDGNTDGDYFASGSVTHTSSEAEPWWQVDLGAVTEIGQVVLYNRTDCCSERLSNFDILLSADGTTWQTAATYAGAAPQRTALSIRGSVRYVRVKLHDTGVSRYLSLAEVEVFPPQNLAEGKPATQSSTYLDNDASRAVDGNTDGNLYNGSVTRTEWQFNPWWQVDLGAVTEIGRVVLYNRTDCCSERLSNFEILLSDDGTTWRNGASFPGVAPTRTELSVNQAARFVHVRLLEQSPPPEYPLGPTTLSLAEVRVLRP